MVPAASENGTVYSAKSLQLTRSGVPAQLVDKWAWNVYQPLTDAENSSRFTSLFGGRLRYCAAWKKWLVWDGRRWQIDESGQSVERAKATVKAMRSMTPLTRGDYKEAYEKHLKRSGGRYGLISMVELAKSEAPIPVAADQLDADPWALNCLNGIINLRTGEIRNHRRQDLLTKLIPVEYHPDATCPTFHRFLTRIMDGNTALIAYFQRIVGYCLTGDVGEKAMFILFGEGNNGKTTFVEAIRHVLADYAGQVPIQSLMKKKGDDGISNDIAQLKGKRFVTSSETESGHELAVSKIKHLTGLGTLQARFLYGEFFEFEPTFKILMDCNHKPIIRGHDPAIWNRVRFLPFTVTIPNAEIDRKMGSKLRAEAPGILAWAVRGCLEWQERGLDEPCEVKQATENHRHDMDTIGRFIAECCEVGPNSRETKGTLHAAYEGWCHQNGEQPETKKAFGMALERIPGLQTRKDGKIGWFWKGIRLRVAPTGTTPGQTACDT